MSIILTNKFGSVQLNAYLNKPETFKSRLPLRHCSKHWIAVFALNLFQYLVLYLKMWTTNVKNYCIVKFMNETLILLGYCIFNIVI